MNEVLLTALLIIRFPKIFHCVRDFTKVKPFPPILQYGTSKVESDRKKQKCLTSISILSLQEAILFYLIWKNWLSQQM